MNIIFTDTEQSTQRRLKRYSGKLAAAGSGVILFGVWNIVKVVLFNSFNQITDIDVFFVKEIEDKHAFAIALYMLAIAEFILRFYIGKSARREAFGKKQTSLYLVISCLLLFISGGSTASIILSAFDLNAIVPYLVTIILEGTSLFVFGALIYYSIRTKLLMKSLKAE